MNDETPLAGTAIHVGAASRLSLFTTWLAGQAPTPLYAPANIASVIDALGRLTVPVTVKPVAVRLVNDAALPVSFVLLHVEPSGIVTVPPRFVVPDTETLVKVDVPVNMGESMGA